jgi:hypothetical protein
MRADFTNELPLRARLPVRQNAAFRGGLGSRRSGGLRRSGSGRRWSGRPRSRRRRRFRSNRTGLRGSDRPCGRGSMDRSHSRCRRWRRLLLPGRRGRLANRSGRRPRSIHGGCLFGLRSIRRDMRRGDCSSCSRPILGGHGAGRRHRRFRGSLTRRRSSLWRDRPRGSVVALHLSRRRL